MKIISSLNIFIFLSLKLNAQVDYSDIDKRSLAVPDTLKTAPQISSYLTQGLTSDIDKVRAFYYWIAHNIRYDVARRNFQFRYKSKSELIDEVLEKRKGLCQHYAELFNTFCQNQGIKSYAIAGYARQSNGEISGITHVWNAVCIGSSYYNIDVTWASGYLQNNEYIIQFRDNYFLIDPKLFVKTHLPFDPIWEFVDNPIDIFDFNNMKFDKLSEKGDFNYRLMINIIEKQDRLTYLTQLNKRLTISGELNELLLNEISENVRMINYEKCRIAVDSLNVAIDNYNLYMKRKNSRFRDPVIDDKQIRKMIEDFERPLLEADIRFQYLFTLNSDLKVAVDVFRSSIESLKIKANSEKEFIKKYEVTAKPFRFLLFK
jgi:hypothetical protein